MTQRHILIFIISLFINFTVNSQEKQDSIKTKVSYGIRVGVDISKPIISFLDSDRKGLELTGDIKVAENYYAAVELGYEDALKAEDYFNFTAKGSFVKIGINYNAYENWKGMNNEIYIGTRYAFSLFSQTLNSFTPNSKSTYFIADEITPNTEFNDLNAHWIEFLFGMKVETFKNLFLGAQFSIKKMLSTKEPENFKNLYIPGFNQVSLNNIGVGFNYTLSYNIPIISKYK
tara:strand:- start:5388 stop:6080 length:693 start_codon:yes stop_codon:yes gene_type:complete